MTAFKVLILGGYGTFGGRLAALELVRDSAAAGDGAAQQRI
jgi:hypothetical protein